MLVYLEILDGPSAGQRHPVWEGVRIGRSTGEVLLDDAKVSSLHAQVEADKRGSLVLADRDSANGLKINGNKVKRVALLLGVRFQVGRTTLRVAEISDEKPPERVIPIQTRAWKDVLLEKVPIRANKNRDNSMTVEAFRPALQLDFIEGQQMDHQVLLGYGPRRFGSDVLDVELIEPLCPPLAFEIRSEGGAAYFKTQYPKLVLLNDVATTEAPLKEGDRIRIGQTLIQVSFAL
ncbi:MAG: FHA domain-containing protein [Bdellovibrio sp.]|jgi:hypothetical protein